MGPAAADHASDGEVMQLPGAQQPDEVVLTVHVAMNYAGEEDGKFGAGGLSSDEEVERFLAPDSLDPEALRYGVGESPPPPAGTQPLHSQQGEPRDEAAAELADLQAWGFDGYDENCV